ncbi:hypothetical protein [Nocardia sp. NPDC004711]
MSGDGPKALQAGAVRWLGEKNALLPGITTLERLVLDGKQLAGQRLWTHLTGQLTGGEPGRLGWAGVVVSGWVCCRSGSLGGRGHTGEQAQRLRTVRPGLCT